MSACQAHKGHAHSHRESVPKMIEFESQRWLASRTLRCKNASKEMRLLYVNLRAKKR